MKASVKTYVPTEEWGAGEVFGTGPRWRLVEERALNLDRRVRILGPDDRGTVTSVGVDSDGKHLFLVYLDDGSEHWFQPHSLEYETS